MAGSLSGGQSSHKSTGISGRDRVTAMLSAMGIVLALVVVVAFTRLYRISDVPPGIINDEGANGVDALQVLQGEHKIFFAEKASGREPMAIYATALATRFLGPTLLAFHLPPALASAGTVFAVFWLGLLLFGRDEEGWSLTSWRGLTVAGVGAGLLAASLGQTILARGGFRANFLPPILTLSLALLWWAWRNSGRHRGYWCALALAGAIAGLLPYTYIPARFTPFLFLFLALSSVMPFDPSALERLRDGWPRALLFTAVAGLVAAPILIYFVLNPDDFFFRSKEIWLSRDKTHTPLGAFLRNVVDYLLLFGFRGDRNLEYNFAGRPVLNFLEAIFFWAGVGTSLWRWRRRSAYRLLLIWLAIMLLPALLSYNKGHGPNSLRIIGAVPAVYLLVGVGVWEVARLLIGPLIAKKKVGIANLVGILVAAYVLFQAVLSFRTYFHEWIGTPEYYAAADAEMAEAARVLNAQSSVAGTVNLIPYSMSNGHYGFEYLYEGTALTHVIHAPMTHLPQRLESLLAAKDDLSLVKVVDWNDDLDWIGKGEEYTVVLLEKYGTQLGSESFPFFQVHTYTDISFDLPWTFYERLNPPTVYFDGGISLLGFAIGQGGSQLSTQHPINLGLKESFWIALQWETVPELNIEYAISLRLHNDEGDGVFQEDIVLLDWNQDRTANWFPEQPVDTLYHMAIPANIETGTYEMRLVVYDYETLKPTVELGVWAPEAKLAVIRVTEGLK